MLTRRTEYATSAGYASIGGVYGGVGPGPPPTP